MCLWYKDDPPKSQQKFIYYLSRLNSKAIVRDSGHVFSLLTRDLIKQVSLVLGQNTSFARGFDKILHLLLVSDPFPLLPNLQCNEICFFIILL